MPRLRYLAAARRDLLSIMDFLARESGSVALASGFVNQLRAQCARLAALPGTLGRPRPELHPDIRSFPFKGYVIFFRYVSDTVEIVNVIEGHRDVDELFREGDA